MCSLVAGLTAISGIMQYNAQQEAAENQAAAYRAQAETAKRNAEIEDRKVEQQVDNTAKQQSRLRIQRAAEEGKLRASAGSAGIGMGGSVNDLLSVSNEAYLDDQSTLLSNERNQTYDTKVNWANFKNQEAGYRSAADNVISSARTAGIGTLLGTATSIAGMQDWGGSSSSAKTDTGFRPTITYSDGTQAQLSPWPSKKKTRW